MLMRRALLPAIGLGIVPLAVPAGAQTALWPEWFGSYAGTMRFYRSMPLEDIYPPPAHPHEERESPAPFAVRFAIRAEDVGVSTWLRIDGGPMQTAADGEFLHFGPTMSGFSSLIGARARPRPLSATLTIRPQSLGTEALFTFADGSFWRRHFHARFTEAGADLIIWVFDASGTRARTWRGTAVKQALYEGRAPT